MAEYIKSITLPTANGGTKELMFPYGPDLDSRFKKVETDITTQSEQITALEEQISSANDERITALEEQTVAAKQEAASALSSLKAMKKRIVEKAVETGDWSLCETVCETVDFTGMIPDNDVVVVKDETRTLVLDGCKVLHAVGFDGIVTQELLEPSQSWKSQNKSNSIHQINVPESPIKLWEFATPPTKLSGICYNSDTQPCKFTKDIAFVGLPTVTAMGYMFCGSEVKHIDFSHFDTSGLKLDSQVTPYHLAYSLQSVDLEWIRGVKLASHICFFNSLREVESIDLTLLDTSESTNMQQMFNSCCNLKTLDLSSLKTGKVTDMHIMFGGKSIWEQLDVSGLDTSNVTRMDGMFGRAVGESSRLQTITGLSNFNTSKVTDMAWMFQCCGYLKDIDGDIGNWDTSSVTNMHDIFTYCTSFKSLNLHNWNTEKVEEMCYFAANCSNLEIVDLSSAKWTSLIGRASQPSNTSIAPFVYSSNIKVLYFGGIGTSEHITTWDFGRQTHWGTEGDESRASLIATLLTLSADRSDKTHHRIYLSSQTKAVLIPEEIAAITARGYTIA